MNDGYQVRALEPVEYPAWDRLVEESPQGTVYNKSFWLLTLAEVLQLKYRLHGCFKGEALVGGIGVFYKKWGNKKLVVKPPYTPYTGVLLRNLSVKPGKELNHTLPVTEALIKVMEGEYDYLRFVHHWALQDIRSFIWADWETEIRYTYIVALDNVEALFASLHRSDRKPIEKAAKMGFTCHHENDFEELYRLLELTFAKQNLPPPFTRPVFFQLVERLSAHQACKTYFVKNPAGQNISGFMNLVDPTGPHGWIAGTDPAYLNVGAGTFMYWQIFRDMAKDYAVFDLDGANLKSIAQYKKNMGGTLVPYYITTKTKSRLLRVRKIIKEIPKLWR